MVISADLLMSYYNGRAGLRSSFTAAPGSGASATRYAPTAPWDTKSGALRESALVTSVLAGRNFIEESAAKVDLKGASADYKKLFAVYQGLNAMSGLASRAGDDKMTPAQLERTIKVFNEGLAEIGTYVDKLDLEQIRLSRGAVALNIKSDSAIRKDSTDYKSRELFNGTLETVPDQFQGNVQFSLSVKRINETFNFSFDLGEMGSTPRTLPNVVNYMNNKLKDAEIATRFAVERTPAESRETEINGTKITLPAVGDAFALAIKGDISEKLTFTAPAPSPAVYVTTKSGNPDPDADITTTDAVYTDRVMKIDVAGASGVDAGARLFDKQLADGVSSVRASQTDADGNLYVLADLEATAEGQPIKGQSDVALMKYDSAGTLLFTRTLGASSQARGLALAIDSATGNIAVAGSVTGALSGTVEGALNSGAKSLLSDSFVTLMNKEGDEVWTQRRAALAEDEATAIGFGASGEVVVAGRSRSSVPGGGGAAGGYDNYVMGLGKTAAGTPVQLYAKQLGTAGDDSPAAIVINSGKLFMASNDGGQAVLRSFDLTGTSVTQTSQRSLGELAGGSVVGLAMDGTDLVVGGQTRNSSLNVDGVSSSYHGGMDGFVARVDSNLTSRSRDALSYVGGTGNDKISAMQVAGGQVWLAGEASADFAGPKRGTVDGFVTAVNVATGQLSSTQRISGKDGYSQVTSLAVASTGASALDRLGLPKGEIDYDVSQLIVAGTAARAGDQFEIRTREGARATTITLKADDTLETLASRIRSSTGFRAKVEVITADGKRQLKISPINDQSTVEILPGADGKNLLEAIGLQAGVARNTVIKNGKTLSADGNGTVFGLGLPADFDLRSEAGVKAAQGAIADSLKRIREAYKELENLAKPKSLQATAAAGASGPVPAYLTAQIANYQSALARLSGG